MFNPKFANAFTVVIQHGMNHRMKRNWKCLKKLNGERRNGKWKIARKVRQNAGNEREAGV